jgi:S1-C subfamily serine protease
VVPQLERGQKIQRAYLGVSTKPASASGSDGAEVDTVVPGGPADSANLRSGDVITKVAGQQVKTPEDVAGAIANKRPGDKVQVEVERNGLTEQVTAKLGKRPPRTP